MYTGFNAKKERKRTQIGKLQDEIKKLHQLLGAMMHIHERMKNERVEGKEVTKVSALPTASEVDIEPTKGAPVVVLGDAGGETTSGKDQKGA
jgi:hypothetical protein